jgi:hypothetical protein
MHLLPRTVCTFAGGPCGVLAAVQAHLVATLMERQLWHPQHPATATCSSSINNHSSSSSSIASTSTATAAAAAAGMQCTPGELQDALSSSLALVLWNCTSSSDGSGHSSVLGGNRLNGHSSSSSRAAAVVTLSQSSGSSAVMRGLCDVAQVLRVAQVATAHSLQEVEVRCMWTGPAAENWG